jgi:hypothetical protein
VPSPRNLKGATVAKRYSIAGTRAVTSPTKTLLGLTATSGVRPRIADIMWGSAATPADNAIEWLLQRYTAAGTSTSVTPTALDPADPTATATAGQNHTVEPTYTSGAVLLDVPMNQRSTQRWVASPGYEFVCPATAANGAGWQPVHASFTGNTTSTILFEE